MDPAPSRTAKAGLFALGSALASLAGLGTYALLSRLLPVQEYATYRQVFVVFAFAAPALAFGLPEALSFFLPGADASRRVATHAFGLLLTTSALFCAGLWAGGAELLARALENPALAPELRLLGLYALFAVPLLGVPNALVARDRVGQAAGVNALGRLLPLALVAAAVLFRPVAHAALLASLGGAALVFLAASVLVARATAGPGGGLQMEEALRQLRYAAPIGAVGALAAATASVDKFFVASACPPPEFARYVNGALEVPLIGVVTGAAMTVALPEMSLLFREGRREEALDLWKRAARKTALVLLPTFVFCFALAPEVMTFLFSARFTDAASIFRIHLLLLPLRVVYFGTLYQAAGRGELSLLLFVVGLLTITATTPLLLEWQGAAGAALAVVGTTWFVQVPLSTWLLPRLFGVRRRELYPLKDLGLRAAVAVGCAGVLLPGLFWTSGPAVVRLVVFGAAYSLAVLTAYWRLGWVVPAEFLGALRGLVRRKAP